MGHLLGHRYSHSTVSRITDLVLERVEAFRTRSLKRRYAIVYLDCLFVKVLREGGIRKEAVYVVLGIDPEGHREVLGFYLFPNESAVVWQEILQDLWKRGMREVLVFVSDGLPGMEEAILGVYPNAEWQRCLLHKMRNTLAKVRREDCGAVALELKRIYLADSQKRGRERPAQVPCPVGKEVSRGGTGMGGGAGVSFRLLPLPEALWTYLRSTNLLERFIRELRRGTKARDHQFPKPEAIKKLLP